MNFSIDTNIIIGLINSKDRIHEPSMDLMNNKRNDQLFLCNSALKESHNVLRNKINEIMAEIIRLLPDIYHISKISTFDSQYLLIEQFKKMKIAKPGLANFLDLVFHETSLFLRENEIDGLPTFLSELSINLSGSIFLKIEELHPNFEMISLNLDRLNAVKKSLTEVYFKDTNDDRIFQELMTNLEEIKPIEFILDDRNFAKKSMQGFENIARDLGFANSDFTAKLLSD